MSLLYLCSVYYYCMSSGYVAVTTGHAVEFHLLNCWLRLNKYVLSVLVGKFNILTVE